jgi:hypothetical protein
MQQKKIDSTKKSQYKKLSYIIKKWVAIVGE